jgi:hypothetical protein
MNFFSIYEQWDKKQFFQTAWQGLNKMQNNKIINRLEHTFYFVQIPLCQQVVQQ